MKVDTRVTKSGFTKYWIRTHYQEYLSSKHWLGVRARFQQSPLSRQGCYNCGAHNSLNLHHKTYKRVGEERLDDLIYLCSDCHHDAHRLLNQMRGEGRNRSKWSLWTVARRLKRNRWKLKQ